MKTGRIKWFDFNKEYGFIESDDKTSNVFLHVSALEESGISHLDKGQRISFQLKTFKDKISAVDVKLI